MRRIIGAVLAVLLASGAIAAQTATVEFDVVGFGTIATLEHTCPLDEGGKLTRYTPATITCTLRALDTDGAWTPANFVVTLTGPTDRVTAEVTDSILTINILRFTGVGGVRLKLEALPILHLAAVYIERPLVAGKVQVDTIPPLNFAEGEWVRLCAYVGGYGRATAKGQSASEFVCPDMGAHPLPSFPISWRPGENGVLFEGDPTPVVLVARR